MASTSAGFTRSGERSTFTSSPSETHNTSVVELSKSFPEETVRFLERALLHGGVAGVIVIFPCLALLSSAWERCALCERPLRLWLSVASLLHLVQTPLRFLCYRWLKAGAAAACALAPDGSVRMNPLDISTLVSYIMKTRSWRVSQAASAVSLGWLVIGTVWVGNASPNGECPEAYYLTVMVLAVAGLRFFLSVSSFRSTFSFLITEEGTDGSDREPSVSKPPLNLDDFLSFRCGYTHTTRSCGSRCSVCLSDFHSGQRLRLLPCGHYFHQKCVDPWLLKRCDCPLCRSDESLWPDLTNKANRQVIREPRDGDGG